MEQEHNLGFAFLRKAADIPSSVALRAPTQQMTYDQLRTRVIRYALHLKWRGIGRHSCVALDTNRAPEGMALPLALALVGARWVRLSSETLFGPLGVTDMLSLARRPGVPPRNFHVVDESWIQPPPGIDLSKPVGFEGYGSENDTAIFTQSSGTTGRVKFMAKSYRRLWIQASMSLKQWALARDCTTVFNGFPPLSGVGFHMTAQTLLRGGCIVVGAEDVRQLKAMGTQHVFASPARIEVLCKNIPPLENRMLLLTAAGAMMNRSLIRHWLQYFEQVGLGYGSQEAWRGGSAILSAVPDADTISYDLEDDVTVEIVDAGGTSLPANTVGTIRIKTPEMVHEYVAAPEASAEAFRDGWFYPGDLGSISEDSRLSVHGRVKDQFNFGGVKANAADVDEVSTRPAEVQAAVSFARTTDSGLDELCVLAVLAAGAAPERAAEQIRQSCRSLRGQDLIPGAVFFADHLPLNENGKPMRETAREMSASLPAY